MRRKPAASPASGARKETIAAASAQVSGLQIAQPVPADEKPGAEIGEEDQPEHDIQRFD
jgi:hypothetical protein